VGGGAEKAHNASTHQVPGVHSRSPGAGLRVELNQTDEVEIIGHARQLATDSLQREKEAHGSTRTRA
jgi:hypothetical protein